jgi:NTP pyrophosphatase (non-canonical NTP hydrolase)
VTTIRDFQRHIADLYLAKDERRGAQGTMLWMVEEVGELAEAVRRREREGLEEEMADVLAWLASLANLHGVDLERAALAKYPATCKRCGAKPCACPEPAAKPL